jgi:hypothetical protein
MTMRGASRLVDAVIVTVVFVSSAGVARDLLAGRRLNTLFEQLPPAVMLACGQGLVAPIAPTAGLRAFQRRERSSVSCAEAVGDGPMRTPDSDVLSTRYAAYSVALAFRVGGIAWRTIDACIAIVFGMSMALVYALFRLVTGRVLSAAGVAMLLFSPHALGVALPFRDFSKEFWFVFAWLGIGVLLRRGRPHASPAIYAPAAAIGMGLGVGLGFRVDMAIIVPAVIAVIAFGLRGMTRQAVKAKMIAASLFLVTYGVIGAPILTTFAVESSLSHVIVLGLITPFTSALGLESPPYDLGDLYSDEFATEAIHVHALLVDRAPRLAPYKSRAYDGQGISLLKHLVRQFPADFVVRGLGATRQVMVNPFDPQAGAEADATAELTRTWAHRQLLRWRKAAAGWLHGYELLFIAAALIVVAVRDRWLAVATTWLVLYFSAYSMLQFSRRHTFHLDVIAVGVMLAAIGGALSLAARLWRARRAAGSGGALREFVAPATRAALTGAVLLSVAAGGLMLLRMWQQQGVTGLFERTLAAPTVDMAIRPEPLTPSPHASWPTAALLRPAPEAWPAGRADILHAEYLIIDLGGEQCTAEVMSIMMKYSVVPGALHENFRRTFNLALRSGVQLLAPVLEIPGATHFDGLAVPGDRVACVRRIRRVSPPDAVPLPNVFAVLTPGWRSAPLYQRLRDTPALPGELVVVTTGEY